MSSNTKDWIICEDVNFTLADGGMIASNHRAKSHIWINDQLILLLINGKPNGLFSAADQTVFSNHEGLFADPTCLNRSSSNLKINFDNAEYALDYLVEKKIILRQNGSYEKYFGRKTSIVDFNHLGTFHQRLGMELILNKRIHPDEWWYQQKFYPENGNVRDNLYRFVQFEFLNRFVESLDLNGRTILDFGCGNGMASARFIKSGAHVIGVDPNKNLLDHACRSLGDQFTPIIMDLDSDDPLDNLPDVEVYLVWMADVFLYYFYTLDGKDPIMKPSQLLKRLIGNLADDGRVIIMLPHGVFWLAPWLGDQLRPYTVVTEYVNRLNSVTPSLSEISEAVSDAGLCVTRIHEPLAVGGIDVDTRAYHFANNFPLWWVFECCLEN